MPRIFKLIYPASLESSVQSQDCGIYLKLMMQLVGWLTPEAAATDGIARYLFKLWTALVIVFVTCYTPLGMIISIRQELQELTTNEFLVMLQFSVNLCGLSIKSMLLYTLIERISQADQLLAELDATLQRQVERLQMHRAVAKCNRIVLTYATIYIIYITSVITCGALSEKPPLLIYNPLFNWRDSVQNFWLQCIMESIIGNLVALMQAITDTYTLVYVSILRLHMSILKKNISKLRSDPSKSEADNYAELVSCITKHRTIIRLSAVLGPIFSRTIFVQFLLIGMVLGITLINIFFFSNLLQALSSFVYCCSLLLETFPFCYLCDLLVEDCKQFSYIIAHSYWIGAERRYKSTLRIFMLRLQQPIQFVAGGIFLISLNNNIKVAKIAFSVMTLVEKMNLAERFE